MGMFEPKEEEEDEIADFLDTAMQTEEEGGGGGISLRSFPDSLLIRVSAQFRTFVHPSLPAFPFPRSY